MLILKVWWHDTTLFYIIYYIHSFHHIHTIHSSVVIHRGSSPSPHRWSAQWDKPPWGAEPRIELELELELELDPLPMSHAAPC